MTLIYVILSNESHLPFQEKSPDIQAHVFSDLFISREDLIAEQGKDPTLISISNTALNETEASKVPVCYYICNGVLMRKWRPPNISADEEWNVANQVVVPKPYQSHIIGLAHDIPMAGHLGVTKTYNRILQHFYWPNLRRSVSEYCKTCHTCQLVGKPNQDTPHRCCRSRSDNDRLHNVTLQADLQSARWIARVVQVLMLISRCLRFRLMVSL